MRIVSRVIAAIAALVLLGLLAARGIEVAESGPQTYSSYRVTDHHPNLLVSLYSGTLGDPEAFWGAIAALVTVIGFVFVIEQLRISREAAEHARRTADSYIQAEIGEMTTSNAHWEYSKDRKKAIVHFGFMNVGKSKVVVLFQDHKTDLIGENEEVPKPGIDFIRPMVRLAVATGQKFATWSGDEVIAKTAPCEIELNGAWINKSNRLVLRLWIMYEAMGERYYHISTHVSDPDGPNSFNTLLTEGYHATERMHEP